MNHQNSLQNSIRRLERARQPHPSEHEVLRRARAATSHRRPERREREAQALASLTGWNIDEVRKMMDSGDGPVEPAGVT